MEPTSYRRISRIYDSVRTVDKAVFASLVDAVTASDAFEILDIGCGTANYALAIFRLTGRCVCGVDPSDDMLAVAREKCPGFDFRKAAAERLPFESGRFSLVYMTDVIHHVRDVPEALREIRRVLKPGGRCCIATQSHEQIRHRPLAAFFPDAVAADQARYPDIDEIVHRASDAGLYCSRRETVAAGDRFPVGGDILSLVEKKGYSMLHLIPESTFQEGLDRLRAALSAGPPEWKRSGETLLWLKKPSIP